MGLRVTSLTIFGGASGCGSHADSGLSLAGAIPANVRNARFTSLSSSEWKVMIARRPPGARASTAAGMASSTTANSSFTAMRIPWNVRVAG